MRLDGEDPRPVQPAPLGQHAHVLEVREVLGQVEERGDGQHALLAVEGSQADHGIVVKQVLDELVCDGVRGSLVQAVAENF